MADRAGFSAQRRTRSALGWLALGLVATACQGARTAESTPTATTAYDQVMSGVSTTLTTDSSHQTHVIAESAFVYQQAREIHFRNLGVTLFDRQGGQAALMHGQRAVYSLGRGVLDLRGKVVLVTLAGDSLTTQHLIYDQRAMELRSDSAFAFRSRAGVIQGKGFTTDLGMRGITAARRPDPPR